jgi:hypothetical protein
MRERSTVDTGQATPEAQLAKDMADLQATEGVQYLSKEFHGPIKVSVDYAGNDSHSLGVEVEISGLAEEPGTVGDPQKVTFVLGMYIHQAEQLGYAIRDAVNQFEESISEDALNTLIDESSGAGF